MEFPTPTPPSPLPPATLLIPNVLFFHFSLPPLLHSNAPPSSCVVQFQSHSATINATLKATRHAQLVLLHRRADAKISTTTSMSADTSVMYDPAVHKRTHGCFIILLPVKFFTFILTPCPLAVPISDPASASSSAGADRCPGMHLPTARVQQPTSCFPAWATQKAAGDLFLVTNNAVTDSLFATPEKCSTYYPLDLSPIHGSVWVIPFPIPLLLVTTILGYISACEYDYIFPKSYVDCRISFLQFSFSVWPPGGILNYLTAFGGFVAPWT
ncbi:hypothetical protein B0H16DRAFT_1744419 [Mycena metata]|uniref:Uncharacterized protein n=1 Tax=Mycena metata TaxID=1033252 RepID=A0AAD7H5P9_9AGAR|nr:hypothetical protein B0H16DRAFT_1744419 [Mycena metata]